jgi:hypothetical protein
MLAVEVEIDIGEVGGRATINDHFVEDQEAGGCFGGFTSGLILSQDDTAKAAA